MNPSTSEQRVLRESIDPKRHPVITRRYTIVTPMMHTFVSEMVRWIRNGVTGAVIVGDQRIGKSKLRRYIGKVIEEQFSRLPVFSLNARKYELPSERVFFGDLLRAFRHPLFAEGTAAQRRERLVESILSVVQSIGEARVVLLIDQAHNLFEFQFEWLVDLFNELDERGIELFVFLFGQSELSTMCDEFRRAGKKQIIGRFMVDRIEYHGIRSHTELRGCLACYDEGSQYPEQSGWTFTRYFFPGAYDKGWRLTQHSRECWKAFREVLARGNSGGRIEIPMQHFTRTIEQFLVTHQTADAKPTVTEETLMSLVIDNLITPVPRDDADPGDEEEDRETAVLQQTGMR